MRGGQPVGVVGAQGKILSFDAHSGAFLTSSDAPPFDEAYKRQSFRNTVKHLHRMTSFGDWALWINMTAAVILIVLIVTGTLIYLRQHKSRRDMGRPALFWTTSGGWRMLHRWISAGMAIFMAVVVLSGSWLTLESLGIAINGPKYFITTPSGDKMPSLFDPRLTTPLPDAMVGPMAVATLNNYHAAMPKIGLRAIRLRNYAGYAQGVVISGEAEPQQLVFDTKTGRRLSLTEPGYPEVGLPLGWQVHQWAKFIHRGEAFGLSGRMMSLLSGFAMIYLSISGIVMYWELWNRRRKAGKTAVFW